MTKQQIGVLLTSLCAATVLSTSARAENKPTAAPTGEAKESHEHHCQNNSCKGHGECMSYGNESCGGQNSCKGKGWVDAKDAKACAAKKGIWHDEKGEKAKKG
jgi:hypothetical protein